MARPMSFEASSRVVVAVVGAGAAWGEGGVGGFL